MKLYKKIKKKDNKGYFFVANPMIYSFNKPKIPLNLLKVKHPIQKTTQENFIIKDITQF